MRTLLLAILPLSALAAGDIKVVETHRQLLLSSPTTKKIYEDSKIQIYKDFSKTQNFVGEEKVDPLFIVRAGNREVLNKLFADPSLKLEGMVNGLVVARFPLEKADEVSATLHLQGGVMCGGIVLVKETVPSLNSFRASNEKPAAYPAADAFKTQVEPLLANVSQDNLRAYNTKLGEFFSRHHGSSHAKQSHQWLMDTIKGFSSRLVVEEFSHRNTQQKSIIAKLPGKTDEIIVLGAHIDSIQGYGGSNPDSRRAPGQDDDGSGTASLLEVIRVISQSGTEFTHTIQFMGYAAEEVGLWGSDDIAEKYAADGKKVKAVLQLDMDGYLKPGDPMKIFFVSDDTTPDLTRFSGSLVETYLKLPWESKGLDFGTSDHQSWHRRGFKAVFPTENPDAFNWNLHTTQDTIDKLNFNVMQAYSRLAVAFATTLAEPTSSQK